MREAFFFDHSGIFPGRALRCAAALFLLLIYGEWSGDPKSVLFSVVGAFVVGFAPLRPLGGSHATPMLWASWGTALATGLGMLAGHTVGGSAAALFFAGLCFGLMSGLGSATAWVALQCLVFLIVLGLPYPADLHTVLVRSVQVLTGGLLQLLVLSFFRVAGHFQGEDPWLHPINHVMRAARARARALRRRPAKEPAAWAYGLRMGLALVAAFLIVTRLNFPRSPWVMMTVALVFRQDLQQTLTRGMARCAGTLLGGAVATAVVALAQPGAAVLSLLTVISGFLAYLFVYANYAICSVFITGFVVFLLSFEGLPGLPLVHWRIVATLFGGALALLAWFPWRARE